MVVLDDSHYSPDTTKPPTDTAAVFAALYCGERSEVRSGVLTPIRTGIRFRSQRPVFSWSHAGGVLSVSSWSGCIPAAAYAPISHRRVTLPFDGRHNVGSKPTRMGRHVAGVNGGRSGVCATIIPQMRKIRYCYTATVKMPRIEACSLDKALSRTKKHHLRGIRRFASTGHSSHCCRAQSNRSTTSQSG